MQITMDGCSAPMLESYSMFQGMARASRIASSCSSAIQEHFGNNRHPDPPVSLCHLKLNKCAELPMTLVAEHCSHVFFVTRPYGIGRDMAARALHLVRRPEVNEHEVGRDSHAGQSPGDDVQRCLWRRNIQAPASPFRISQCAAIPPTLPAQCAFPQYTVLANQQNRLLVDACIVK